MKMLTFAGRCAKEILRDTISLGFGLGFPLAPGAAECNHGPERYVQFAADEGKH